VDILLWPVVRSTNVYGTSATDVQAIVTGDFPRLTAKWKKKRLLLYAHGGLVPEDSAVQHVADYRAALLDTEVYPLAFIWKTDYWSTLKDVLSDCLRRRRPEGILDKSKDFMLDRLDDALEPIARIFSGKLEWSEMKENALLASTSKTGGARIVAQYIAKLVKADPSIEVHMAGHSAGSIFHGGLVPLLVQQGVTIQTCTLWAPACTVDLFNSNYVPALKDNTIKRFAMFTLNDHAERDDNCANIYHKSLLYLVSDAFEERPRIPIIRDGWPILGMEKFAKDMKLKFNAGNRQWILCPNQSPEGSPDASRARSHGGFDDDICTLKATLARILNSSEEATAMAFRFHRSASSQLDRRNQLMVQTD